MKISKIYNMYNIPENLQMHMLRVTACSKMIVDNWVGESINSQSLYRVLLLHDMGNIVKIPEDEFADEGFLSTRRKYFQIYGKDDHQVSIAIGKELGLSPDELQLMNDKIFTNNEEILKNLNYETMIGAYCDQRVAPNGIMPLLDRLFEAKQRYKNKPGSSMNNPRTDFLIDCAMKIEQKIMKYCKIKPSDISDVSTQNAINFFRRYDII